ncbi:MAG: isopentenyl-diphosphate Delta-isomerase [Flavobacteriales bacterium]|nr:isopentenyl-diphosphate Delta-isomerase [Flavobacteriales bacterium]|tara:strand:+ start:4383 stop:4916 length:534 start_codon:yes stop_codon:yes gene_type:complete
MKESLVIHVNEFDEVLGFYPKLLVHEKAMLHRAVSVLIFNSKGEWLLQKRAETKYHSGGLWTNTCCTHPYPEEDIKFAAERRLIEEMGMRVKLEKSFDFIYNKKLDKGLTEHEFDHVFIGYSDSLPELNPEEAEDWTYLTTDELELSMKIEPESYTEWFKILFLEARKKVKILKKAI